MYRNSSLHVLVLIFPEDGLQSALRCSDALYSNSAESLVDLEEHELLNIFNSTSCLELFLEPGMTVYDLVMKAGLFHRPGILTIVHSF